MNATAWAEESFEISESKVYSGVKENQSVSDDYVKDRNAIAERQIVLGGYRLASLLKSLKLDEYASVEKFLI